MWQLIAKGVLGGIGGGLKEVGNKPKFSDSEQKDNQKEEQLAENGGSLLSKIMKIVESKKDEEEK